jgi:hypothetical protein
MKTRALSRSPTWPWKPKAPAPANPLAHSLDRRWRKLEHRFGNAVRAYEKVFGEGQGVFLRRLRAAAVEAYAKHRWREEP